MECGSWDGVPIVAIVTGFGLGEAGIVWVVVAAEFINHQIQRRNDIEAKSAGSGFEKGILRRASDMSIGVVFGLKAVGCVWIVGQGCSTFIDVISGDNLQVVPFAVVQQTVGESQGVSGVQSGAASAGAMGHDEVAPIQAIPRHAPALGSAMRSMMESCNSMPAM